MYDSKRRARCEYSDWVPIIFLSGRVAAEAIVAGIESGGDDYLTKPVAKAMESTCKRSTDLVARYGGEEFVAILPDTSGENAAILAEQMRQAVENLNEQHFASDLGKVSISMGGVFCLA